MAEDRIRNALQETFSLAAVMGVSLEALQGLVSEQFGIMSRGGMRVAFIECNLEEAQGTARRMHRALGYPVDPFVLDQLPDPDDLISAYPFISTTLYHLPEVQAWLGGRDVRPIGLEHSPSTESQLAIARLPSGTRIGVVASNERTLNVLVRLVESFHARIEGSCLVHQGSRLAKLAARADFLVTHPLAARALKPEQKTSAILVEFQIQPQSLAFLEEQIARPTRESSELGPHGTRADEAKERGPEGSA